MQGELESLSSIPDGVKTWLGNMLGIFEPLAQLLPDVEDLTAVVAPLLEPAADLAQVFNFGACAGIASRERNGRNATAPSWLDETKCGAKDMAIAYYRSSLDCYVIAI